MKVVAEGVAPLTSQLYFPHEPANEHDRLFDPRLLLTLDEADGALSRRFRFVLV